jgi:hypothetical protein
MFISLILALVWTGLNMLGARQLAHRRNHHGTVLQKWRETSLEVQLLIYGLWDVYTLRSLLYFVETSKT